MSSPTAGVEARGGSAPRRQPWACTDWASSVFPASVPAALVDPAAACRHYAGNDSEENAPRINVSGHLTIVATDINHHTPSMPEESNASRTKSTSSPAPPATTCARAPAPAAAGGDVVDAEVLNFFHLESAMELNRHVEEPDAAAAESDFGEDPEWVTSDLSDVSDSDDDGDDTAHDARQNAPGLKERLLRLLRAKYNQNISAEEMESRLLGATYEREVLSAAEVVAEHVQFAVTRVCAPIPCSRVLRAALAAPERDAAVFVQQLMQDPKASEAFTSVSFEVCAPGETPLLDYSFTGPAETSRLRQDARALRAKATRVRERLAALSNREQRAQAARDRVHRLLERRAGEGDEGAQAQQAVRRPAETLEEFQQLEQCLHESRRHRKALKAIYRGICEKASSLVPAVRAALARTLAPAAAASYYWLYYRTTEAYKILQGVIEKHFGRTSLEGLYGIVLRWLLEQAVGAGERRGGGARGARAIAPGTLGARPPRPPRRARPIPPRLPR